MGEIYLQIYIEVVEKNVSVLQAVIVFFFFRAHQSDSLSIVLYCCIRMKYPKERRRIASRVKKDVSKLILGSRSVAC